MYNILVCRNVEKGDGRRTKGKLLLHFFYLTNILAIIELIFRSMVFL